MTCIQMRSEGHLHGKIHKKNLTSHNMFTVSKHLFCKHTTHLLICIAFWRCDRILWYGRGLTQLCYVRGESRFSDHRPVYSIFTAEVQIPSQAAQFGGITRSASLLGLDELPYPTYPRSYMDINFYWLCVSMRDGGWSQAKVCILCTAAGTGSILVIGAVLFKPRCSDWCSEFHVKAFLLLIITPHVVFTAECRQTFLVTWVGRAHLLMTDWLKFISPKVPSVGMFAANRWFLLPYVSVPLVSGVFIPHFFSWCLEILLLLTPQFLPSSTCRYSRRCFLIVRLGMICWSMSRSFMLDFKQAVRSTNTCSLYHEWAGIFAQFWI